MSMVGSIHVPGQQLEADMAIVAVLGLVHPETLLLVVKSCGAGIICWLYLSEKSSSSTVVPIDHCLHCIFFTDDIAITSGKIVIFSCACHIIECFYSRY